MKDIFYEYYYPDEDELKDLWNNGILIPDSNVLLNLYRYSEETRDQLFGILDRVKERLWLLHQVGEEFHKNRSLVIKNQEHFYESILSLIGGFEKDVVESVENTFTSKGIKHHPYLDKNNLIKDIQKQLKQVYTKIAKMQKGHPQFLHSDAIRDHISVLFENRIGAPYSQEQLKKIYVEGDQRYASDPKIPPGYEDAKNKSGLEKYGDLVIWKQMLDKAKETKKPILFITSDAKEDWWLLLNKNEKISPRYELIKEMHSYADVGFHIYEMDHFIERAGDYLNMTFDRSKIQRAVTEMKELEEPVVGKDHKLELTSGMPFADVVEVSYYPEIPSVDQATVGGARIVKLEEDSDSTGANTGINFSKAGKKKGMKNKK